MKMKWLKRLVTWLMNDDSRREPEYCEAEQAFDWRSVATVDPEEVDRWFGCTDAKDRQLPFHLALQVHDELEALMMSPAKMDGMKLSEMRGGLRALSRFCKIYQAILDGEKVKK